MRKKKIVFMILLGSQMISACAGRESEEKKDNMVVLKCDGDTACDAYMPRTESSFDIVSGADNWNTFFADSASEKECQVDIQYVAENSETTYSVSYTPDAGYTVQYEDHNGVLHTENYLYLMEFQGQYYQKEYILVNDAKTTYSDLWKMPYSADISERKDYFPIMALEPTG